MHAKSVKYHYKYFFALTLPGKETLNTKNL